MMTNAGKNIIREAVDAHGGMDLWNRIMAVEAVISASGFLFSAKHRPVLDRVRMRAAAHEPRFTFYDHPHQNQTAELIGNEEVRIMDPEGKVLSKRVSPRSAFRGLRHALFWDELDLIYFAGYATWNYLTTPFLLQHEGVEVEYCGTVIDRGEKHDKIRVLFPEHVPTHSRDQFFYFGEDRLLRRLDYTAEVVGGWAHAAHFCYDYRVFGGIKMPTQRRVIPMPIGSTPMPWPTLVRIQVHDARLIPRSTS